MKRMFFCFLLGVGAGGFGHWYFQQESGKKQLEQARAQVVSNAQMVATTIKDKFNELSVDDIKEEMARSSMVVREKAKGAGESIAGVAANARITAAIKTRLISEPGLSAFAINVDTTDGLVTLSGKVDSHDQVARAVKIALETDGVHKVISTLQVVATAKP
jgi:osmotically-inducible protein OsmY